MRALIQRVTKGKVVINKSVVGEIKKGLVIFLGIREGDGEKEVKILADKTAKLRIMADRDRKMNLSVKDVLGEVLVISQFTLFADCRKGRRPSFISAADPKLAEKLYALYIEELKKQGIKKVAKGEFGAYMAIDLVNDGPVTIILDTDEM